MVRTPPPITARPGIDPWLGQLLARPDVAVNTAAQNEVRPLHCACSVGNVEAVAGPPFPQLTGTRTVGAVSEPVMSSGFMFSGARFHTAGD